MTDFGDAFRKARSGGAKTFTWRGKLYNTKLAQATKQPAAQLAKAVVNSATMGGSTTPGNPLTGTPASVQVPLPPPAGPAGGDIPGVDPMSLAAQRVRAAMANAQGGAPAPQAPVAPGFFAQNPGVLPPDMMNAPRAGMKRGGKIKAKPKGYAKGGSVSSRGDGIAQRGKTKGRMV